MSAAPLLVTGTHRSGTTWVGKVLARAPGVGYVDEPFHPGHRPGVCRIRPRHWYQYVDEENEHEYEEGLRRTLAFRYGLWDELRAVRTWRDLGRIPRDLGRCLARRFSGARALIKDPIAFFATPWLVRRFGLRVVILVRHPAAFASSLKRMDWRFDFANWLDQERLMRTHLAEYADEIAAFAREERDVVEQAGLMWKAMYGVAHRWHAEHPDWILVRHEDLSIEPLERFATLFSQLDLEWTGEVEGWLRETTASTNPAEAPGGQAHALRRDSKANVANWKQRLEADEVARLRAVVGEASELFYAPGEW